MTEYAENRRTRRQIRKQQWQEKREASQSVWLEAWFRYREVFCVLPSPVLLARESEGAIELGLVRIPALIVYAPIYYILLYTLAIFIYPPLLISTIIQRKSQNK